MEEINWIHWIIRKINEFSNIELQRDVWILGIRPDYISSYTEAMCSLFDDLNFEEFLQKKIINKYGLKEELNQEMEKLSFMLRSYKEKETDSEIIKDPEWHKVVSQARHVMELWEMEKPKLPVPRKNKEGNQDENS